MLREWDRGSVSGGGRTGLGRHRGRRGGSRDQLAVLSLLEAGAAEYGASLSGTEGDGGFNAAGRTVCSGFGADTRATTGALGLALLAALGVVFKILVVEKQLLARGEDEIRAAINAFQYLIREFHGRLPRSREPAETAIDLRCAGPVFPVFVRCPTTRARAAKRKSGEVGFRRPKTEMILHHRLMVRSDCYHESLYRPRFTSLSAGKETVQRKRDGF